MANQQAASAAAEAERRAVDAANCMSQQAQAAQHHAQAVQAESTAKVQDAQSETATVKASATARIQAIERAAEASARTREQAAEVSARANIRTAEASARSRETEAREQHEAEIASMSKMVNDMEASNEAAITDASTQAAIAADAQHQVQQQALVIEQQRQRL